MTPLVDVTLPGQPVSKGRPRLGRGGTYTPERTREAEERWRWALLAARPRDLPYTGPVRVELEFHCATRRRRDGDNMVKLVLDALNPRAGRGVLADDSQAVDVHYRVFLGAAEPRTVLRVFALSEAAA